MTKKLIRGAGGLVVASRAVEIITLLLCTPTIVVTIKLLKLKVKQTVKFEV